MSVNIAASAGFHPCRRALGVWHKHEFISPSCIPGRDTQIEITIYMDIAINPGPNSAIPQQDGNVSGNINHYLDFKLDGSSRSSTSHLHTAIAYSTKLCYSRRELLNIRRVCSKTVTSEVLSFLKWAGVLKYRGRRAGSRKIPVVMTARNTNRRYLNRIIVKKNLVNIELQKDSTVSQHLQLALFNTRSINNKAMYLKDFVVDHEIDLLALTEIWLDSIHLIPKAWSEHGVEALWTGQKNIPLSCPQCLNSMLAPGFWN